MGVFTFVDSRRTHPRSRKEEKETQRRGIRSHLSYHLDQTGQRLKQQQQQHLQTHRRSQTDKVQEHRGVRHEPTARCGDQRAPGTVR